jgi:hypothetical protein
MNSKSYVDTWTPRSNNHSAKHRHINCKSHTDSNPWMTGLQINLIARYKARNNDRLWHFFNSTPIIIITRNKCFTQKSCEYIKDPLLYSLMQFVKMI